MATTNKQYLLKRESGTIAIIEQPRGARVAYLDDGRNEIMPDAMRSDCLLDDACVDWTTAQHEAHILADIAAAGLARGDTYPPHLHGTERKGPADRREDRPGPRIAPRCATRAPLRESMPHPGRRSGLRERKCLNFWTLRA